MKIYAPEYYKEFKCIADKCKHSCCIGWEIDIDPETLNFYRNVTGDFGECLKNCISEGEDSHFILGEGERCPFLNKDNLCDIYTRLGEENLCQICSDHPRFRNFFDSRTEIGLGLCCEAVCDLVLSREKAFDLTVVDENDEEELCNDTEDVFFALRNKAFQIINNEEMDVADCIETLLEKFGVEFPEKTLEDWMGIFCSLEILDPGWTALLKTAKNGAGFKSDFLKSEEGQRTQRRLLEYFLFRHTGDGLYDGTLGARVEFGILSLEIINLLCAATGKSDFDTFKDIARRYSAEIEYCEENIERLIDILLGNN